MVWSRARVGGASRRVTADVVGVVVNPSARRARRGAPRCHGSRGRTARGAAGYGLGRVERGPRRRGHRSQNGRRPVSSMRPGSATMRTHPGQHHRPVGVASAATSAARAIWSRVPRCRSQPAAARGSDPGISSLSTVRLGDASAKSIAAQCFGIPMSLSRVAAARGGGVRCLNDRTSLRFGDLSTPAASRPPCARRSAISASAIAWVPPAESASRPNGPARCPASVRRRRPTQ